MIWERPIVTPPAFDYLVLGRALLALPWANVVTQADWLARRFRSLRTPNPSRETGVPSRSCIRAQTSWPLLNQPQPFADRRDRNGRQSTDPHDNSRASFQTEIQIA